MAKAEWHRLRKDAARGEPTIDQGIVNGWHLSWNPDDDRFYVGDADGVSAAVFSRFDNAVRWARTHKVDK